VRIRELCIDGFQAGSVQENPRAKCERGNHDVLPETVVTGRHVHQARSASSNARPAGLAVVTRGV